MRFTSQITQWSVKLILMYIPIYLLFIDMFCYRYVKKCIKFTAHIVFS